MVTHKFLRAIKSIADMAKIQIWNARWTRITSALKKSVVLGGRFLGVQANLFPLVPIDENA